MALRQPHVLGFSGNKLLTETDAEFIASAMSELRRDEIMAGCEVRPLLCFQTAIVCEAEDLADHTVVQCPLVLGHMLCEAN